MRTRHYVAFAAMVVLGLVGGLLVMARGSELALIRFRDQEFEAALKQYEAQLAAGDLSASVVTPLCQLYLQYGRVDAAVTLMERFVRQNPRDVQAHRELARYYQYAQRSDDYIDALERLARLEPSEDTLRRLSDIYSFRGQVEAQITVLQQLIRLNPGQPSDLLALAQLQAAHGNLSAAAGALERLHDDYPEAATSDTVQFFISVLLDARQTAKATERAARWLSVHRDPEVAARYASLVSFKGHPKEALLLLEPFATSTPPRPDVLEELIRLEISDGRRMTRSNASNGCMRPDSCLSRASNRCSICC